MEPIDSYGTIFSRNEHNTMLKAGGTSRCGWINHELKLSDRLFICKSCGLVIDRDLNAAINIRNIGLIKVGLDRPEFTPVEIATSAELFNRRDLRDVGQ